MKTRGHIGALGLPAALLLAALCWTAQAEPAGAGVTATVSKNCVSPHVKVDLHGFKAQSDPKTGQSSSSPTWTVRNAHGATTASGKFEFG